MLPQRQPLFRLFRINSDVMASDKVGYRVLLLLCQHSDRPRGLRGHVTVNAIIGQEPGVYRSSQSAKGSRDGASCLTGRSCNGWMRTGGVSPSMPGCRHMAIHTTLRKDREAIPFLHMRVMTASAFKGLRLQKALARHQQSILIAMDICLSGGPGVPRSRELQIGQRVAGLETEHGTLPVGMVAGMADGADIQPPLPGKRSKPRTIPHLTAQAPD